MEEKKPGMWVPVPGKTKYVRDALLTALPCGRTDLNRITLKIRCYFLFFETPFGSLTFGSHRQKFSCDTKTLTTPSLSQSPSHHPPSHHSPGPTPGTPPSPPQDTMQESAVVHQQEEHHGITSASRHPV